MKKILLGVDVSKEKLDVCKLEASQIKEELILENQFRLIKTYLKSVLKDSPSEDILICAEYTGQYTYQLSLVCDELGLDLWLENPTQIKYRSGVQRGKSDKLDARKIAEYACKFQEEANLFFLPEKTIMSLKQLISERDLYVVDRAKYQGQLTDQKRFMSKEDYARKSKRLKAIISELTDAIEQIEKQIQTEIDNDQSLSNQHKLLCSIDGIGERTAVKMIVETNAFTDFDDPRKFCCHAGVAPFEYISGSSQRSRNRVSNRADKSIKALLHMAALIAATRMKGELHEYYLRKVAEGKNKMTVLNAIRAKLIHRMFAVIRNNQPYQKNYLNPIA